MNILEHTTDRTGGPWAGQMILGDTPEFIRITWGAEGQGVLDRPQRLRFQLPLQAVDREGPARRFQGAGLVFAGTFDGTSCAGTVREGTTEGSWTVQPEQAITRQVYQTLIGHYRLVPDREIALSQDERPEEHLYFYVEQDRVVRLYPHGPRRFLSERLEILTLPAGRTGAGPDPPAHGQDAPSHPAVRVASYLEEPIRTPVE